jgi:hypothetical protein
VPLAHVVPLSSGDAAGQGACLKTSPKGCEHPHVRFVPVADISICQGSWPVALRRHFRHPRR